jgi:hypothetical protein
MIGQILPNNNEKYYNNFSPPTFSSKHTFPIELPKLVTCSVHTLIGASGAARGVKMTLAKEKCFTP